MSTILEMFMWMEILLWVKEPMCSSQQRLWDPMAHLIGNQIWPSERGLPSDQGSAGPVWSGPQLAHHPITSYAWGLLKPYGKIALESHEPKRIISCGQWTRVITPNLFNPHNFLFQILIHNYTHSISCIVLSHINKFITISELLSFIPFPLSHINRLH